MLPAILDSTPRFKNQQDIVKPHFPALSTFSKDIRKILRSGKLTNNSEYVRCFEESLSQYLNTQTAVVANATLGLMLVLQALKLKGEVILPSFTYIATGQAVLWNNLKPVLVDCDRQTFTIDCVAAERAMTSRTSAIIAVNVFGNMPQVKILQNLAKRRKIKLIFDSAQGLAASYKGKRSANFADAEVFSFHATKNLPTGEGGVVTSANRSLIEQIKKMRAFGLEKTGDCLSLGLNAKMMEFSAILGLVGLKNINQQIASRKKAYFMLRQKLSKIPGISFQEFTKDYESSFQNMVILINENKFGLNRNKLRLALEKENIITKPYFYPPLHRIAIFKQMAEFNLKTLKNTEFLSECALCIPLYPFMQERTIQTVSQATENIHYHAGEINKRLKEKKLLCA